jgi:hypothetical protein
LAKHAREILEATPLTNRLSMASDYNEHHQCGGGVRDHGGSPASRRAALTASQMRSSGKASAFTSVVVSAARCAWDTRAVICGHEEIDER